MEGPAGPRSQSQALFAQTSGTPAVLDAAPGTEEPTESTEGRTPGQEGLPKAPWQGERSGRSRWTRRWVLQAEGRRCRGVRARGRVRAGAGL